MSLIEDAIREAEFRKKTETCPHCEEKEGEMTAALIGQEHRLGGEIDRLEFQRAALQKRLDDALCRYEVKEREFITQREARMEAILKRLDWVTCIKCTDCNECPFAFDPYNTNGDCLASK